MAVEQARQTRQSDEAQPPKSTRARRSRADDRAPDTCSDRGASAPAEQNLRQALEAQIGQAIQPVLDELQHQLADAMRRQLDQGLLSTREKIEGEINEASQPRSRQDRLQQAPQQPRREGRPEDASGQAEAAEPSGGERDETPKPQSPGTPRRAGVALKGVVETGQQAGEQATALSPLGAASAALGAALQETVTRLVGTLRELLLTVRGLLRTVVALLGLILAALRDALLAPFRWLGQAMGAVVRKIVAALLKLILAALRDRLETAVHKLGKGLGPVIGRAKGSVTP